MTIRAATLADVPRLVALGRQQLAASYGDAVADHPAQLTTLVTHLLTTPTGAVFVADRDGVVVGMIWLLLTVHHASGVPTACEVSWYVDPAARGAGLGLLRRAERWAAEMGAEVIQMVAPATDQGARVGRLYARRGYAPLETSYQQPVTPAMAAITVVDDVVPDFPAYLAAARGRAFGSVETGSGAVFHGIAAPPDDTIAAGIHARWPTLTPTLSVLRLSPAGQVEPHFIHVDTDMGDWTAITYLTEAPPAGDGTTFWRQRATGALAATAALAAPVPFDDLAQWEPWTTMAARPNRLVLFPACYFHSRALADNYGTGDTARLIALTFGTGAWPPLGGG